MNYRRFELDFIAPARRPRWLGYALLAISLGIGGDLVVRYREAQFELERIEAASALLDVNRRPPQPASPERLDQQVKNIETIVNRLALPWAVLIQTLENASTKDVAILQLQPDAQQRTMRVTAEARDRTAMLEYLRRLAESQSLFKVHLISHQVQLDDPQKPTQFSVLARLKGAS